MKQTSEQFLSIYLPLQPAMQRMAERLLHDEDTAADLVQDCFVELWHKRDKLKKVQNKEAWCIAMIKHRCIDLLRKQRPSMPADCELMFAEDNSQEIYEERLRMVQHLIKQLPEHQAEAVRLRHFEAFAIEEIAKRMNTSEGNVYTMLSRAYKSMRQHIVRYEE